MPLKRIPEGESPFEYDGFAVYQLDFVGRHGRVETRNSVKELAARIGLEFKIIYEGDGRFRFQVKGRGDRLETFERAFDRFVRIYGNS